MRLERVLRETRDAGEDLVGGLDPDVPLAALVVHVDELANRRDELAHGAMHAALELFGRQGRKPAFDEIQPRGIGRREMQVDVRMGHQERPHGLCLVSREIVGYSTLSRASMTAMKVISDSLEVWKSSLGRSA